MPTPIGIDGDEALVNGVRGLLESIRTAQDVFRVFRERFLMRFIQF